MMTIYALLICLVKYMDDGVYCITVPFALRIWFPGSSNHVRWNLADAHNSADLMHSSWRWAYGIGCLYGFVVIILIAAFMEET